MGNKRSTIRIGSLIFPIYWAFPDELMALYQRDELIKSVSYVRRDTDEWYNISGIYIDEDNAGDTVIHELYLQTPARTLLDRIRLLRGATGALRSAFRRLVEDQIASLRTGRHRDSSEVEGNIKELTCYGFEDYRRDLRSAMVGDRITWAYEGPPPDPSWLLDLVFRQERYEASERLFLDWLATVADVARDMPIVVDVLDLIVDSIDESALLRDVEDAYALPSPDRAHFSQSPLIVFTEGTTDARWLGRAVALLRPDIAEFVRFFDYKESRVGGGASEVVRLIRALSEVGITSPMLVLLDNDTAGLEAKRQLRKSSLRPNIRVRSLPPLDLLCSYPTLGPAGLETLDINGRAASIECYFGVDVLRDGDGVSIPVQWMGWNHGLRQYQGELVHKNQVQKRIEHKLDRLGNGDTSGDWSGVERIIEAIIMSGEGRQID